ncbi:hypothetical protein GF323_04715 [Candidatus Woesearchaeota archaeon]|nr:hypothetical protein [Candidatus Woesearchaeota archaeon]
MAWNPIGGAFEKILTKVSASARQHGHFSREIMALGKRMHKDVAHLDKSLQREKEAEEKRNANKMIRDAEKTIKSAGNLSKHCDMVEAELVNCRALAIQNLRKLLGDIVRARENGFNQTTANNMNAKIQEALAEISRGSSKCGNVELSVSAEAKRAA